MQTDTNKRDKFILAIKSFFRWLIPGIGLKRWLLIILLGITLIGLGIAVLLIDLYRTTTGSIWLDILSFLSLRFLNRPLRAIIFGGSGLLLVGIGIHGLNRAMLKPFIKPGESVLETITTFRKKEKGPRIVTIGGGTGLSILLRGLKQYTHNLTALVTVMDDGGSSGELRKGLGILPPGDIRACLAALSDDEELLTSVFQYRFGETAGMNGHSLGNLLISALADITGSFESGVSESGRVLAIRGRVLPVTLHDVKLVAAVKLPDQENEVKVVGESQISKSLGQIRRLWLEPDNPSPFPPSLQALLNADLIIVGPGSLYTSIIPNLLVPDLSEALRMSRALKFFICNVATQRGETDGYTCMDHVRTIEKHIFNQHFDVIICNNDFSASLPKGIDWVKPNSEFEEQYSVYFAALAEKEKPWRHDSKALAEAIIDLFYERTGPLGNKT